MPAPTYERWEKFCVLVALKGRTHVDALLECGFSPHGSHRTHLDAAKRMMERPWIQNRIAELTKRAEDKAISTVKERKLILTEIQRAKVSDFVDEAGNLCIKDRAQLATAAVQEIKTVRTLTGYKTTLKLRDPVPAIAEHNKMEHVYEPDKSGNTYNTQFNIIVQNQEAQTLLQRVLSGERTEREIPSGN